MMEKSTAQLIVKIYAILAWLSALIALIAGVGILVGGSMLSTMGLMMYSPKVGGAIGILTTVFVVVLFALAAFEIIVGIALWRFRPWARVLALIFSILSLFSFPIGTLIGAFGIWLFGFEPTVKSLFGVKTAKVAVKSAKKASKKSKKKKR